MDARHIEPALRDVLRETLDAEHGPHPEWAGSPAALRVADRRRSRWPLRTVVAAAAVLVVAIGGYQLLPGGLGSGGTNTTAPPVGPAGNGVIAVGKDGDIFVADRPGGDLRPLVAGPEEDSGPMFSPDGTKLAFAREIGTGWALMVADADGTNVVQVAPEAPDAGAGVNWGAWSFAPDSRSLVAFAYLESGKRVAVVPLDPIGATMFLDVRLPASMYSEAPRFRPTNPHEILVLAQPDPDGPRALSVYDLATGRMRTIVEEPDLGYLRDVAWLPDGEHIVYGLGPLETHVVAADGSGDRILYALSDRVRSSFSNDGTRIVVERGGVGEAAPQLAVVRVDGEGEPVVLACGHGSDGCPTQWTWSPDDSTLIGIRYEGEEAPLKETYWQADPDTGQVTELGWVDVGAPAWQRVARTVDSGELSATPPPSPSLLARGSFVTIRGSVELDAAGEGSGVIGHMTVAADGAVFTVDLRCARTTEDGLIMIGGYTTDTNGLGSGLSPVGTLAGIVLKRGSPAQATVWSQRGGGTAATSCPAYLDERFDEKLMDGRLDDDDPGPIEGTVELGP